MIYVLVMDNDVFTFQFNGALFMVTKKGDERHLHEYLTTFNSYVRIPLISPPGIAVAEYLHRNGVDW